VPLPCLDDFGVRLPDERPDTSERLAPPVGKLGDASVDQMEGEAPPSASFAALLLMVVSLSSWLLWRARHISITA
jgi:hypothetical protein